MLLAMPRAENVAARGNRWGVVLAGGDGVRLRPLTRFICGDDRPKQFCPLFHGSTLMERTLRRAERIIPPERLLVSLTSQHRQWYSQEARLRSCQRVVQPANKGTAPPIAHSLLSILHTDQDAVVAILPSDHYYSEETLFLETLESAFRIAADRPESVVLLGAEPDCPEVEYGWIELGTSAEQDRRNDLFQVQAFQEKPPMEVARKLLEQGAVWNTFVMVGRVDAFLRMILAALPELNGMLASAPLWQGSEIHIKRSLYGRIPCMNLSQRVLAVETGRLLALRLGPVGWSDLGDPARAMAAALDFGTAPRWAGGWQRINRLAKPVARAHESLGSKALSPLSRLASA